MSEDLGVALVPLLAFVALIPLAARGGAGHVFRRELRQSFTTPTFYVIAAAFLLLPAAYFEPRLAAYDATLARAGQPGQGGLLEADALEEPALPGLARARERRVVGGQPRLEVRRREEEECGGDDVEGRRREALPQLAAEHVARATARGEGDERDECEERHERDAEVFRHRGAPGR